MKKTVQMLFSFLLFCASSSVAHGFYPESNQTQKDFTQKLNRNNFVEARQQFEQAFSSRFKKSATGIAFKAYLNFRSGFELSALNQLLTVKSPGSIAPALKKMWQNQVTIDSPLWKSTSVKISRGWQNVFPYIGSFTGRPFQPYSAKSKKTFYNLAKKKMNSPLQSDWHNYQLSLIAGQLGLTKTALKYIQKVSLKSNTVNPNLIAIALGRLQFQNSDFKQSVIAYSQVNKKSDYWSLALEEQAWAYTRMGRDDLSLAKLKSLTSQYLSPFATPESFMLRALNQERTCDYISSFQTVSFYKTHFLPVAEALEKIKKGQAENEINQLIVKQTQGLLNWKYGSKLQHKMPFYYFTDRVLYKQFAINHLLHKELAVLSSINQNQTGLFPSPEKLRSKIITAQKIIKKRLKYLARKSLSEISNITKKMHLIEAEVIQQLHVAKNIYAARKFKAAKSNDVLVFPDDGEIWKDEIDKYRASVSSCNKNKAAQKETRL